MVKGISRRVVVVRPPNPGIFEEAIFVIRETHESPRDILREACAVAESYLRKPKSVRRYRRKRWTSLHLFFAALCGGISVGSIWAFTAFLHFL
mgnify:FL=1|jgi:hypothetical protein